MSGSPITLPPDYWESLQLNDQDIEYLYNYLLETETPCPINEIAKLLIEDRVGREKFTLAARQNDTGNLFSPKNDYQVGETVIFPALGWRKGEVIGKRQGHNPDTTDLQVIQVALENGKVSEFASNLPVHKLNDAPKIQDESGMLDPEAVFGKYGALIARKIDAQLESGEDFVRIAGSWFPKALLVDINTGHLNLVEAVLDMSGGGPLSTSQLLEAVGIPLEGNSSLNEFSLDYALWQDERFDEVGPAGQILWYLHRLEPAEVLETPALLKYHPIEYNQADIHPEMLEFGYKLDDELSDINGDPTATPDELEVRLIYPHWRAGTLPLSHRLSPFFPTAYQAPRIRFMLVNGETGKKFPGWVVRGPRYVYGLKEFYAENDVFPGSILTIKRGAVPGEVIIKANTKREVREWLRTVLIGSDGNLVLAMLKQRASTFFDDRMAIAVPEPDALDAVWEKNRKEKTPVEKIVVKTLRDLSKLTPQGNVHFSELYAAVNLSRRIPPGPLLALLNTRPGFTYVGNHHYKLDDAEK